ncbi:hypothetical protein YA0089_28385 [Pseudomonas viridiflava]|uniref:hypothetical protein n=1 Tax=Pseudomonas viridiflava TaxID=33069 RepID=UPI0018E5F984|nr:hypothetical protein [Pseudomonas viridiflava]MBI6727537.1 hypothetical protein [Pseudomonas viridiflava]
MRLELPSGTALTASFETFKFESEGAKSKFRAKHIKEFEVFVCERADSASPSSEVATLTGYIIDFAKIFDDLGIEGLHEIFKLNSDFEAYGESIFQKAVGRITIHDVLPTILSLFNTSVVHNLKAVFITDFSTSGNGDVGAAAKMMALAELKNEIGKPHLVFSECVTQAHCYFGDASESVTDDRLAAQSHRIKNAYRQYGFVSYGSESLMMCQSVHLPEADLSKIDQYRQA